MATDRLASVHLDIDPLASRTAELREIDESPFDIVLAGDFSGRDSFGDAAPDRAPARPLAVDRDDFDEVLARIAPRVRLRFAPGTTPLDIVIQDIDDFHPDRLLQGPLFAELRELRRRAHDPAALPEVAARLGLGGDRPPAPATSAPDPGGAACWT